MELVLIMAAAVVSLVACLWFSRCHDPSRPPYPTRPLPIVGHLLFMKRDARPQFKQWREKCGDIFSLNMAGTLVVVLNGYDVITEALVKNGGAFSGRPPIFFDKATGFPGKGIGFTVGDEWHEQRSTTLAVLRKFGLGKNLLAEKIQEEVVSFCEYLKNLQGTPANIWLQVNISIANIICSIIIGQRFSYNDIEFQKLITKLHYVFSGQQNCALVDFMPWVQNLPGDILKTKKVVAAFQEITELLKKFVQKVKERRAGVHDSDNFIESYFCEMDKKIKAGKSTFMDEPSLIKIMIELLFAGTDTTSGTIYWCILYMIRFPDVQEKVCKEIRSVVGADQTPGLEDKSKLTYLNAVIMETQRLASIVPLAMGRICSRDTYLRGYLVTKGTYILTNLDSVHHDKSVWGEDAMTFRPERFIDENGVLKNPEELLPFSTGRRSCLGESLAMMELFLFLSTLFQRFQFLPANPSSPPSTDYIYGFVVSPVPYEVKVLERL